MSKVPVHSDRSLLSVQPLVLLVRVHIVGMRLFGRSPEGVAVFTPEHEAGEQDRRAYADQGIQPAEIHPQKKDGDHARHRKNAKNRLKNLSHPAISMFKVFLIVP